MLMKRRSPPVSSQMLLRIPGCLLSSRSMTSFTVPASTSMISAPAVCFRSGVGITTLSDMSHSFQNALERIDFRVDDFRRLKGHRVRCFQAIARDRDDGDAIPIDVAAFDEFFRDGDTDAARGL